MTTEQFTNNFTKFDYHSDIRDKVNKLAKSDIENNVTTASQQLVGEDKKYRTTDGSIILNADPDRIWFSRYVAFLFAVGRIFDDEDKLKMDSVMSYFSDNHESAFLNNIYKIESYKDSELVVEIEKKLRIGNGNYHVIMVPIVYANDLQLEYAPESQFKRAGILDKYTSWEAITEYMKAMIVRYGLITRLERTHQLKPTDVPPKVKSNYDDHTKFSYNADNENIKVMPEIESTLAIKQEMMANKDIRVRQCKQDRNGDFMPLVNGAKNMHKRKSLYKQMHEAKYYDVGGDSVMSNMQGVSLKIEDKKMPKDYAEYQIYDDDNTYDFNFQKNMWVDVGESNRYAPQLQQFATRASQNSRNANINVSNIGQKALTKYGTK